MQFIHETVREYLLNPKAPDREATTGFRAHTSLKFFQEATCHLVVAEESLRYLLDLSKSTPFISAAGAVAQHPLARYAAQHWWQHMHESNIMYDQRLLDLALQLLNPSRCLLL